jgi:type II secretory pathway pseudopilin PulG
MPDLLEWTIADAPLNGEVLSQSSASPATLAERQIEDRARRLSHQLWIIASLLIVGLLAALWLPPLMRAYRTRQAVALVVAGEEQAALAKDAAWLRQFSSPADTVWQEAQARRARAGHAAPLPIPLLRPLSQPGRIQSIKDFAPDIVRADVVRMYVAPDGTPFRFTLPQFYRFTGTWQRIPAPDLYWGDQLDHTGRRVVLSYYPVDADIMKSLGPYLDDVLARACAAWGCPDDLVIRVNFGSHYYQAAEIPRNLASDEPLLFALMPPHFTRSLDYVLFVAAPHAAGYPADAVSADLFRRAIATQVLFAAADKLTFADDGLNPIGNAFFYALVARMSARLGLDAPGVARLHTANTRFTVEQMWSVNTTFRAWGQPEAVRGALAVMNALLQDRPAETEDDLFDSLRSASDPATWLADGMGISVEAAQRELERAAANIRGDDPQGFYTSP